MDYRQVLGFLTGKPSRHPYPEHMQDGRRIAADGMVLLKNEGNVLPLKDKTVALFGAGAVDTVYCGTGSGYVFAPYNVSVMAGLENAGITITSTRWLSRFQAASQKANKEDKTLSKIDRVWSGLKILIDDLEITDAEMEAARVADTAIYVLRRSAGEGGDRKAEKGDYYLSVTERKNIEKVAAGFQHTVIVLNSCVIDAGFLFEIQGIDSAVLMGLAGNEAGNALADVLTGKVCPSGRLTDTWAKRYEDNPASATFGSNDGNSMQEDYTENIYVGYRYFDSFHVEPLFPFGYGLSYTGFAQTVVGFRADWERVSIQVKVKNTGGCAGREVVQVYVSAPEGRLDKPFQELKGYAKSRLLLPGDEEILTVSIPTESLASFDTEKAAFIMEEGSYIFRIGKDSRHTVPAASLCLDGEAVLRQVENRFHEDHPLSVLKAPKQAKEQESTAFTVSLRAADCVTIDGTVKPCAPWVSGQGNASATLVDVAEGRVKMEDFVNSLDEEVLYRLVAGSADEVEYKVPSRTKKKYRKTVGPSSSGSTTALFVRSLGIPNWLLTDGPAGCHLPNCGATGYPVGMVIAQTWDDALSELAGLGMGKELKYYNYSILLGPGLNIHRDPLCGRAFEYYSEDPLISGKMAAAATRGVQATKGAGVSIKHFAANSQEADRLDQNSTITERALREIYLRGFEICVREASPKTMMTSYNQINGLHTSSNRALITDVLRGEWGFKGLVMTDWGTHSTKTLDLAAGNDLIMGGYRSEFLKAAVHGSKPEFASDGYVVTKEFKVFGGFFTNIVEYWNAFELAADGPDSVSVTVAPGNTLNEKVPKCVDAGTASVTVNADGSKTILYHGIDRGATLALEDVKACAARTLEQLMDSVSYQIMIGAK